MAALRVAAVVLAAGGSTRLGRPKQLLLYKGSTLVRRAVETASAYRSSGAAVFVLVGARADDVKAALVGLDVTFVENAAWEAGMGSSIVRAMHAVADYDAALFMTCDQPAVTAEHLTALVDRFARGDAAIVASSYKRTNGTPAIFASSLFPELRALDPAGGAKPVIARDPARVAAIDLPGGEIDIDTEADYANLTSR